MEDKNIICFDNYEGEYQEFSNWFIAEFSIDGRVYASLEQYMMFSKAALFGDGESAEKVMSITDPAEIKALGRQVKNYDDHLWNGFRQLVVYRGLKAKFSQNENLRKKLLSTGQAFLAECEPTDKIWGIGMDINNPARISRKDWQGQNLLGYTLMQVRSELQD